MYDRYKYSIVLGDKIICGITLTNLTLPHVCTWIPNAIFPDHGFFCSIVKVKGEYSSCLMILVELLTVIVKTLILQTTIYYVGTFHMIFSCWWMC